MDALIIKAIEIIVSEAATRAARAAISAAARTEKVVKILKQLDLDPEHPGPEFSALYVHTLVEYGVDKSAAVLQLFRDEDVKSLFREAWEKQDYNQFQTNLQSLADRLAAGDKVKAEQLDLVKELQEFWKVFDDLVRRSRLPKDAQLFHAVKVIEQRTASMQANMQSFTERPSISHESILLPQFKSEMDAYKSLIDEGLPRKALGRLLDLKTRSWHSLDDLTKYKLLTNIGSAHYELNELESAEVAFKEAYELNKVEAKACANYALVLKGVGKQTNAERMIGTALSIDRDNSWIWSVFISVNADTKQLDELLSAIPQEFHRRADVAAGIGIKLKMEGRFAESIEWLKVAMQGDCPRKIRAFLACTIIESYYDDGTTVYTTTHSNSTITEINEAVNTLETEWGKISNSELSNLYAFWLQSIGLGKRLLGELNDAVSFMRLALKNDPSNVVYKKNLALLLVENGEARAAISFFKDLMDSKAYPEAVVDYAAAHYHDNQFAQTCSVLDGYFKDYPNGDRLSDAIAIYFGAAHNAGISEDNKERLQRLLEREFKDVNIVVALANASYLLLGVDEAIRYLDNNELILNDYIDFRAKVNLARLWFELERFDKSAKWYEQIVNREVISPTFRKLAYCYYKAGQLGEALEACRELRVLNGGPLEHITNMEAHINANIRAYDEAVTLYETYLTAYPTDNESLVGLGRLLYITGQTEKLSQLIDRPVDILNMRIESAITWCKLINLSGQFARAVSLLYELRRKHFDEREIHLAYMSIILLRRDTDSTWLDINTVSIDCAVTIASRDSQTIYIIEKRTDPDLSKNEFGSDHPVVNRLLGKKLGDTIILSEGQFETKTGIIMSIKHKYVHALHESMQNFERLFGSDAGIQSVHFDPEDNIVASSSFQAILNNIRDHYEQARRIDEMYKSGLPMPVGFVANLTHENIFQVLARITSNTEIGLRCCLGAFDELEAAVRLCSHPIPLTIDLTSLLAQMEIGLPDKIVQAHGKFIVAQSLEDEVRQLLEEAKSSKTPSLVFGMQAGEFTKHEMTMDEIERNKRNIQAILGFIDQYCEVLPNLGILSVDLQKKSKLDEMIGAHFIDTILIASQQRALLCSDDLNLRMLAKTEFNLEGVWTQALLRSCLQTNHITEMEYHDATATLARLNFIHTSISAQTILRAGEKTEWSDGTPYIHVAAMLGRKNADLDTARQVLVQGILLLWNQKLSAQRFDTMIRLLLKMFLSGREQQRAIIENIKANIPKVLIGEPLLIQEVRSIIDSMIEAKQVLS